MSDAPRVLYPSLADVHRAGLATIVTVVEETDLDRFVVELAIERIPPSVIRLREIQGMAGKAADRLELRWSTETGGLGWRDPGGEGIYTFAGTRTNGWRDLRSLVESLGMRGFSIREIAEAISDMRVTDLRAIAERRPTLDARKALLDLIDDHRDRDYGIPHFKKLEEKPR